MDSANQFSGLPPMPVLKLTMEQEFKMRRLKDMLDTLDGDDIKEVFIALQHQNFILGNTIANLLKEWGKPQNHSTINVDQSLFGTLFGTKD